MFNDAVSKTAYFKHNLISDTFDGLVISNNQVIKTAS